VISPVVSSGNCCAASRTAAPLRMSDFIGFCLPSTRYLPQARVVAKGSSKSELHAPNSSVTANAAYDRARASSCSIEKTVHELAQNAAESVSASNVIGRSCALCGHTICSHERRRMWWPIGSGAGQTGRCLLVRRVHDASAPAAHERLGALHRLAGRGCRFARTGCLAMAAS
jgi:hypothetical protein